MSIQPLDSAFLTDNVSGIRNMETDCDSSALGHRIGEVKEACSSILVASKMITSS